MQASCCPAHDRDQLEWLGDSRSQEWKELLLHITRRWVEEEFDGSNSAFASLLPKDESQRNRALYMVETGADAFAHAGLGLLAGNGRHTPPAHPVIVIYPSFTTLIHCSDHKQIVHGKITESQ